MEPPRSIPVPVTLPSRPIRHFSYSFDEPHSAYRANTNANPSGAGGYISPDPTPTSSAFYPQSHPNPVRQSSFAPRGYPATHQPGLYPSGGASPAHGRSQAPRGDGGAGGVGEQGDYVYGYAEMARYGAGQEMDPFFVPALPNRREDKKGGGAGGKKRKSAEVKQPTFLTKLYGILEQQEYNHILRWDADGETIIIERPTELGEKVLPLVYRQSRFASFSRQLNIYGWRRKVSLRHVEEGISDPDASTWSHTTLHRNSPIDEILNFKRRVGPRPSQSKRRHSVPDPSTNPSALSPAGSDIDLSDPAGDDPFHRHLLAEDVQPKPLPKSTAGGKGGPTFSSGLYGSYNPYSSPSFAPGGNAYSNPLYNTPIGAGAGSGASGNSASASANPTPPSYSPDRGYEELTELSPFSEDYPLHPDPPVLYEYQAHYLQQSPYAQQSHTPLTPQPQQAGNQGGQPSLGLAFGGPSSLVASTTPTFPSSSFGYSSSYFPLSAPPLSDRGWTDYPTHAQHTVYQAHLRTRSVQGELPSATLWSPAPYAGAGGGGGVGASPSWGNGPIAPLSAMSINDDYSSTPVGNGHGHGVVQEGWVNCYTNEPMSPPPNSLGMVGARMAGGAGMGMGMGFGGAASVPTSFAPLSNDGTDAGNGSRAGDTGDLDQPFQLRPTTHTRTHSLSSSFSHPHPHPNSPEHLPPATVSPGVYQSGFTPPVPVTSLLVRSVSSPRPSARPAPAYQPFIPTSSPPSASASVRQERQEGRQEVRQERRQSVSSTPYSPRQRQLSLAQLSMSASPRGPLRGLGVGEASGAYGTGGGDMSGAGSGSPGYKPSEIMGTPELGLKGSSPMVLAREVQEGYDEGLPSAGMMEGFAESPFSSLLVKEELIYGDD